MRRIRPGLALAAAGALIVTLFALAGDLPAGFAVLAVLSTALV